MASFERGSIGNIQSLTSDRGSFEVFTGLKFNKVEKGLFGWKGSSDNKDRAYKKACRLVQELQKDTGIQIAYVLDQAGMVCFILSKKHVIQQHIGRMKQIKAVQKLTKVQLTECFGELLGMDL